jgi:hypothetical protein
VWYTGQFYALFFLTITLKVDYMTAYLLVGASPLVATPLFVVFGRLSDRIGRLKIILAGCLVAAVAYIPLFHALTHFANPGLEEFQDRTQITVAGRNCEMHIFVLPGTVFSACDKAEDFLGGRGRRADRLRDGGRRSGRARRVRGDGLRTDRGVPGRTVPSEDPVHVDVVAVSHR